MAHQSRDWIAVTGASGFIGRRVVEVLLAAGRRVVVISRKHPFIEGLDAAILQGQARVVKKSEPCPEDLRGIHSIILLAGIAHRDARSTMRSDYFEINAVLSIRTACIALEAGCKRLVFISSIAVHGCYATPEPIDRSMPIRPMTAYAASKWYAEQSLTAIARSSGANLVIVRPPLVFAAHAPGTIARLRSAIVHRIPLPFGSIRNRRSILALDDLAALLFVASVSQLEGSLLLYPASPNPVSTSEIVRAIASKIGINANIFRLHPSILKLCLELTPYRRQLGLQILGDLFIQDTQAECALSWRPRPNPLSESPHLLPIAENTGLTQCG